MSKPKKIKLDIDFDSLVGLMKTGHMHVFVGGDNEPNIELTIEAGDESNDLDDVLQRVEEAWNL